MRLIVQFERLESIKYISQLDMLRTIHRALRRADIPVAYSEGFNPQPRVSFGFALSVGLISKGEYMDIHLKEEIKEEEFLSRMNFVMPDGMKLIDAAKTNEDVPKIGKMIDCAKYEVLFKCCNSELLEENLNSFFSQEEIIIERHSKKGTSFVDIKPWVYDFSFENINHNNIRLDVVSALSEQMSIKVSDISNAICCYSHDNSIMYYAEKVNTFLRYKNEFITPVEYTRLITSGNALK